MSVINKKPPNTQSGFATVLVVLLVGLAVAASALGTAYYINTSQRTLVSSHALTNAQSGAWSGVEISECRTFCQRRTPPGTDPSVLLFPGYAESGAGKDHG